MIEFKTWHAHDGGIMVTSNRHCCSLDHSFHLGHVMGRRRRSRMSSERLSMLKANIGFCTIWILISFHIILYLNSGSVGLIFLSKPRKTYQTMTGVKWSTWLVLLMRIWFNPAGCRKCTARSWPTSSSSKDEKISEGRRAVDMPGPKFHHRWQTSK